MEKEIISTFKERPKTRIAWWAMGLGLATVLTNPFFSLLTALRPILSRIITGKIFLLSSISLMVFSLLLAIAALVVSIIAFKKGERFWVMWLGFIPAILGCVFWIVMIAGEFLFPH
jgi:hypothetical protein